MTNIVFSSRDGEAIIDLLCAWTSRSDSHIPYPQLGICAEHLISLDYLHPFSPRLRLHIIYAIELIGYQQFEQVGVEEFFRLLDDLQVCAKDMDYSVGWVRLLLDTITSPRGIQYLSYSYWELLLELVAYHSDELGGVTYIPHIMSSLEDAKEWDKLKCWIAIVWLVWPPEGGKTTEEDLEHVMLLLFHQKPGALQKLEEQMEKWSEKWAWIEVPELFQQICKWAHNEAAQQVTL